MFDLCPIKMMFIINYPSGFLIDYSFNVFTLPNVGCLRKATNNNLNLILLGKRQFIQLVDIINDYY